jgi:hypothetical protein
MTHTPDIRGLICIDLWESEPEENTLHPIVINWLQGLPEKLSQYHFDSIINAAYLTKLDFRDISIKNTMIAYNWQQFDKHVMMELIKNCGTYTLSQVIHDQVFGSNTFALYSIESFVKHCNRLVPHVKDWLVIGNQWQQCVHQRGLGLRNLALLPGYNFYGTDWGFMKENTIAETANRVDFDQDFLGWDQVGPDLYKLRPNYVQR